MHASGWPGGWGCSLSQDGASRVMHAPACHRLGPCDLVGHHPALQEGSKPYPQRTRDKVSSCMQHQAWPSALIAVLCAVIRYRIAHAGLQTKHICIPVKFIKQGCCFNILYMQYMKLNFFRSQPASSSALPAVFMLPYPTCAAAGMLQRVATTTHLGACSPSDSCCKPAGGGVAGADQAPGSRLHCGGHGASLRWSRQRGLGHCAGAQRGSHPPGSPGAWHGPAGAAGWRSSCRACVQHGRPALGEPQRAGMSSALLGAASLQQSTSPGGRVRSVRVLPLPAQVASRAGHSRAVS